jgi:hypothetical protein
MSSRGKKKASKVQKEARRLRRDAQELDSLVKDTAAVFRSSFDTGEDSATECDRRRGDLYADLQYRRLAYEIWRDRPGAEALASAMAALIAENERHLEAMLDLCSRFAALGQQQSGYVTLEADAVTEELVRTRLFPDPPP